MEVTKILSALRLGASNGILQMLPPQFKSADRLRPRVYNRPSLFRRPRYRTSKPQPFSFLHK